MTTDIPAFLRINPEERRAAWNQSVPARVEAVTPPEGIPPAEEQTMNPSPTRKSPSARSRSKTATAPTQGRSRKPSRSSARGAARAAEAAPGAGKAIRPGSKLEIVAKLLKRPAGCTTADILKATEWPSVSVPQQAKAAGLTLRQEKDGKVTRYWGS